MKGGTMGQAEVADLTQRRRARRAEQARPEIAAALVEVANGILEEDDTPRAVFVLVIAEDGSPELLTFGHPKWDDLHTGREAFRDAVAAKEDPEIHLGLAVAAGFQRRRELAAELAAKRQEWIESHPWTCDAQLCPRRFETERGRNQHQRKCRRLAAELEAPAIAEGLLTDD